MGYGSNLIKMLTVLFDEKKDAAEKINELEEKYNLTGTDIDFIRKVAEKLEIE